MQKYWLIIALACCSTSLIAQRAQELKPEQITLFSNGTYYLRQEGKLQADSAGKSFLTFPQKPINGTLWIYNTNKDTRINQIDFGQQTLKRSYESESMKEILMANVGNTVELTLTSENSTSPNTTYYGTLEAVRKGTDENNWMVILKGSVKLGINTRVIPGYQIKNVNFPGANSISLRHEQDSTAVVATVKSNKANTNYPVGMMSLQQGMQWKPSYLLRLESKDKARLTLKATIMNDAFDLKDVPVSLVVGNPNMADMSLDAVVGGATPPPRPRVYQRYNMAKAARMENAAPMADGEAYVAEEYAMQGSQSEDFYLFNAGKLSLKKDQRSVVPISQNVVDYEHFYELGLGSNLYQNQNDEPSRTNARHFIKFTNTLDYPMTDGIMMVVDENQSPLAQVNMPYVSKGGDGKVDIANARDVKAEVLETQTRREKNTRKFQNVSYDEITVRCKVKVTNALPRAAKVRASRQFNGIIDEADGGKTRLLAGNYGFNDQTTWEYTKEMPAGSSNTFTIVYHFLTPNNDGR